MLTVTKVAPDTPAAGKLNKGDVLVAINGRSLEIQDPRHPLGEAIGAAEGSDGKMTFTLKRGGKQATVTITLKAIGRYATTWPADCKKSQHIIDETAGFILANGGPDHGITGYCEALFLMSTGEEKYMAPVRKFAHADAARKVPTLASQGLITWANGYRGIFLGEYYLRTGDKLVLPTLEAICDSAARTQYYGGWGHGAKVDPGYVTSGHLHAAGVQLLTTMILGRECGVRVDTGAVQPCADAVLPLRRARHRAVWRPPPDDVLGRQRQERHARLRP